MSRTIRRKNCNDYYGYRLWRYDQMWYIRWCTAEQADAYILDTCNYRHGHSDIEKARAKEVAEYHSDRGSSRESWAKAMKALVTKTYRRTEKMHFDRVQYLADYEDVAEFDRRVHYRNMSWY